MRPEVKHPSPSRVARTSRGPTISVVIASHQARAVLDRYLGVLVTQSGEVGAEVVVVRGGAVPPTIVTRTSASNVKFIPAAPDASVAEMRALGVHAAAGDIILFADLETAAADPDFAVRLRAMSAGPHAPAPRPTDSERADDAILGYLRAGMAEVHGVATGTGVPTLTV